MNKHLTFLSALALTAGLSLQAQNVNQMVITVTSLKTLTMEQTGDFMQS